MYETFTICERLDLRRRALGACQHWGLGACLGLAACAAPVSGDAGAIFEDEQPDLEDALASADAPAGVTDPTAVATSGEGETPDRAEPIEPVPGRHDPQEPSPVDEAALAANLENGVCAEADLLFFEDFESGDYSRWTGSGYGAGWGDDCQDHEFSEARAVSGFRSHRSEIRCAWEGEGQVHRGYGGVQFAGDEVMDGYTNAGVGIDAPHGVVITYWSWLDTSTTFRDGTWFSFFTVNNACDYSDHVLTLGLEDASNILAPAHHWWNGGSREYLPNAPTFPLREWVRTTIYLNYYDGVMHTWQNGEEVSRVHFRRDSRQACQFHWGAYASADNDDLVLYEDDISIWKLQQPWEDFSIEPWIEGSVPSCD